MICTRCRLEKETSAFPKNRLRENGFSVWCRSCHRAWRSENRSTLAEKQRAYRADRPEYIAALNSDWRRRNADHQQQMKRDYRSRKPHVQVALNAKYRAAVKRATPPWADLRAIERLYERAARLTRTTGIDHHVDHIFPLQSEWVCGLHVESNLQVIAALPNQIKGNRQESEIPPRCCAWPSMQSIALSSVLVQ